MSQRCVFIIGHVVVKIAKMGAKQYCAGRLAERAKYADDNQAYRKRKQSEGSCYALKRGKWRRAATLVTTRMLSIIGREMR